MKTVINLLLLLFISLNTKSQPDWRQSQAEFRQLQNTMSQSQAQQRREWANTERHYNSMSTGGSSSGTAVNYSGGSSTWGNYYNMERRNAIASRMQAAENAFKAKEQKMANLIKERNIVMSKSNWAQIKQAAKEAGFDEYMTGRLYGAQYDPDYVKPLEGYYSWSGQYLGSSKPANNTVTIKAPAKPKSLLDLASQQRNEYNRLEKEATASNDLYWKINYRERALEIFEDPGLQFELAKLYTEKSEYVTARSMLYRCKHNEVTANKPAASEIEHMDAYTFLMEGDYITAEHYYHYIYKPTQTNKEIICETASANFQLGQLEYVYTIMKNANEFNPANKKTYTLAGAAALALDSSYTHAQQLFEQVASFNAQGSINKQIAKKLYEDVQAYRKETGKVSVVTIFLLDLAVALDPENIDCRIERYDSNMFLKRKKEAVIDEPFLK